MLWFTFTVYVRGKRLPEVDFRRRVRANDISEAIDLLNLRAATGDPNEATFDVSWQHRDGTPEMRQYFACGRHRFRSRPVWR